MRKILFSVPAAVLALTAFTGDVAAQTATATATYEVTAINEVSTSGNPAPLIIGSKTDLENGVTKSTTWGVTTNEEGKKVTGSIGAAMATDVTLAVKLAAPAGASSPVENVALATTAKDLVTAISKVNVSGLDMTYTLSALPSAGVVVSTDVVVTYTITAGTL